MSIFFYTQFIPVSFAHAGVQKRGDNTIVTFYQSPISPLVGEKVKLTIVVTDKDLNPKRGKKGILTLIDTYYGDESKDKKILDVPFTTDANGAFEFSYTFDKENYFNVNLQFEEQKERSQHIDFLIQPRNAGTIITKIQNLRFFEGLSLFVVGIIATLSTIYVYKYYSVHKTK